MINYINGLIEALDIELTPYHVWENCYNPASQCAAQLRAYKADENTTRIQSTNNQLDEILKFISPYITNSRDAARAAGAAFKAYSRTVNDQLTKLGKDSLSKIKEINEAHEKAHNLGANINSILDEMKKFKQEYLTGNEDTESLKSKFDKLYSKATEYEEEISDYYTALLKNENQATIKDEIDEAKENITKINEEMTDLQKAYKQALTELNAFYIKIIGDENNSGLDEKIDTQHAHLETVVSDYKKTYDSIIADIRKLFPAALGAGLAKAYHDERKKHFVSSWIFTVIFILSLAWIMYFAQRETPILDTQPNQQTQPQSEWEIFAHKIANNLPFTLPGIWLAIFSLKRRSEANRLEQEYAHKTAIASSFGAFKEQIIELNDTETSLMKKLLDATIDAASYNASQTLDKDHGEQPPALDASLTVIEKAVTPITKIVNAVKPK